ncbi:hypothetical protein NUU61_007458 [Penicillium alfredii]|uniref:RRM domain-containing protein n=1 Tax=Penicillium alfredii TaxID=1506179 RepID=A0A9W9F2R2_9EURO|nr:uncharacterized protein NUU61_007458 [Penicillium alfredii]KAJ5092588.1 hypothetical protein NUU61_007458 [Penicillium alfredii]
MPFSHIHALLGSALWDPEMLTDQHLEMFREQMRQFEVQSLEEILSPVQVPIGSVIHQKVPDHWGVVKISNIPYTVTRQEVHHFLGRSAGLISPPEGTPVHIIMERSTGKTMDCYVEFVTLNDARDTVTRINRSAEYGRLPRMGSRHVEVTLSSQDELMQALFPRAKCIKWVNGKPLEQENTDWWSTGFNGFLTDEELFCVFHHAEAPQRSPFAVKVPQRTYESMISTIWKFPWFATDMYTVHAYKELFLTLRGMIMILKDRIRRRNTVGLDQRLLFELVNAGVNCPAFNPRMKYCFAYLADDLTVLSHLPENYVLYFPFDTLTWLPGYNLTTLKFYAHLIGHGRTSHTEREGLINEYKDMRLLRIYGTWWFEWLSERETTLQYCDAVHYESRVMRELIITGYNNLLDTKSSPSSIGTAPKSPSDTSVKSPDSQKTVRPNKAQVTSRGPNVPLPSEGALVQMRQATDSFLMPPPPAPQTPSQGTNPYVNHPVIPHTTNRGPMGMVTQSASRRNNELMLTHYVPHSSSHGIRSFSVPWAPSVVPSTPANRQNPRSITGFGTPGRHTTYEGMGSAPGPTPGPTTSTPQINQSQEIQSQIYWSQINQTQNNRPSYPFPFGRQTRRDGSTFNRRNES